MIPMYQYMHGLHIHTRLNVLKQRYLFYNNKLINEDKNVKLKCLKIPSVKVLKLMKNTINDEAKMSNYCLFHERRQEIHRQWKDDGGVFLWGYLVQGLEISQLKGCWWSANDVCCFFKCFRSIMLPFCSKNLKGKLNNVIFHGKFPLIDLAWLLWISNVFPFPTWKPCKKCTVSRENILF